MLDVRTRSAILSSVLLVAALVIVGCGDDDGVAPGPDAGPASAVFARFDLTDGPMALGVIPWPDDLYLDSTGHVDLTSLPGEDAVVTPEYQQSMRATLRDLDGWGALSPAFFPMQGDVDATSLPVTVGDGMREDASVFLVDADAASPTAYSRVPARVHWDPARRNIVVRPVDGHPLTPGRRYAAVLRTSVRGTDGTPVAPSPRFAAIRDAATRPTDVLDGRAHDEYAPVVAGLTSHGVARAEIAALAVFRVQHVTEEMDEARAVVRAGAAPVANLVRASASGPALDAALGTPVMDVPGLDVEGGVQHRRIGWLINGSFDSPVFISRTPFAHGRFEHDAAGALVVKRTESVPFTLALPRGADLSALRVVIFQHGLSAERSDVLAVADTLCGAGWAVIAIDAPFHGLRARGSALDTRNRFTGAMEPDGFGDVTGSAIVIEFAGIQDSVGELESFHPVYLRDALRQGASDLLMLARLMREGDWSAVRATDAALGSLGFSPDPLGFIGYSLGGFFGGLFVATEPDVGAAAMVVTGGGIVRAVTESPPFNEGYFPVLLPLLGRDPAHVDYERDHPDFWPELAIWQTLLDRGDGLAFAPAMRSQPKNVLQLMARDDETLNNIVSESYAAAIGAVFVDGTPGSVDIAMASAPVRDNFAAGGTNVTRAIYAYAPATHGLMFSRNGSSSYAHPVAAPFMSVAETPVANPVDAALEQTLHFFESWKSGSAEVVAAPAL